MDNTLDTDGYMHLHTQISHIDLYTPLMGQCTYAAATLLGSTAVLFGLEPRTTVYEYVWGRSIGGTVHNLKCYFSIMPLFIFR